MHYGSEKCVSGLGLLRLHCSNGRGLSKPAFLILQQSGVLLLNFKMCHFQNLQPDGHCMMQVRLEGMDDSA